MKNGERRIWLMGTELTLRPISAAEYIAATNEAAGLEAKYGSDEETKKILKGACLTAHGVFDGDERKFSTGEEVLSALNVHEILFAAEEYTARSVTRTDEGEQTLEKTLAQRETEKTAEVRGNSESAEENYFFSLRKDLVTGEVKSEKVGGSSLTEQIGGEKVSEMWMNADIYRISETAERDSRRYDGVFERY